jgi:hypothetical protein
MNRLSLSFFLSVRASCMWYLCAQKAAQLADERRRETRNMVAEEVRRDNDQQET